MEFITKTCKVSVDGSGEISVDYLNERHVNITNNEGTVTRPVQSVFPGLSNNWWTANYGDGHWNLDLDCGCQRFNGVTTTKRINEALRVAGLEEKDVKAVVRKAKKYKHFGVARR